MATTTITLPASRPTLPPEILHQIFLFITPTLDAECERASRVSPSPPSDQLQPATIPPLTSWGLDGQQSQQGPLDESPAQDSDDSSTEPAELQAINSNSQGSSFGHGLVDGGGGERQLPTGTSAPTANHASPSHGMSIPTLAHPASTDSNVINGSPMYPTQPTSLTTSTQRSQQSSSSPPSSRSVMTSLPHSLTPPSTTSLIKAFIPIFLASKAFYEIASKIAYREIVGLRDPLMCARFLKCIVMQGRVSEGGDVENGRSDYGSEWSGKGRFGDVMNVGTDTVGGNSGRSNIKPSLASLVRVLNIEWMSLALLSRGSGGVYLPTYSNDAQVDSNGGHDGREGDMEYRGVRAESQGSGRRSVLWMQMTLEERLADVFEDEAFQKRLAICPGLMEPYNAHICSECPCTIGPDSHIHSAHAQRIYPSAAISAGGTLEGKLLNLLNLALRDMTGLISLTLDLPTLLGVRVRMAELEWKKLACHNSDVGASGDNEYNYSRNSRLDDEDGELKPLYDVLDGCKFQLRTFTTCLPCKPPLAEFLNTQPEIRELTLRGAYTEDSGSTTTSAMTSDTLLAPSDSPFPPLNPHFPLHPSSLPNVQHLRTVHPSPYTPLPTFVVPSRPIDTIHTSIVDDVTTSQVLDSLMQSGKKITKLSLIIFAAGLGLASLLEGLRERDLDRELVALHIVAVAEDYTEQRLEIAGAKLSSFTSLLYMTFMACAGEPSRQLTVEAEKRIAKSWRVSCPSLKTIILPRGAIWFEDRTGWDCLGSGVDDDVGGEYGLEDTDDGHGGDTVDRNGHEELVVGSD